MQLILLEKVVNLGQFGDIVNVRNGYGRNYLIPQGKAKRATAQNKAEFEARRAELTQRQAEVLAERRQLAAKIEGLMVQIAQNVGVDGKLFGSVTSADIAEVLSAQGFEVARSDIRVPGGHLKQTGDYPITIDLHGEVTASITVSVLGASA